MSVDLGGILGYEKRDKVIKVNQMARVSFVIAMPRGQACRFLTLSTGAVFVLISFTFDFVLHKLVISGKGL